LQVIENRYSHARILLDDLLFQNVYDPVTQKSLAQFTYMLQILSEAFTPKLERVLCLGMGMGIVPNELAKKGVQVDVVEINPAMVEPAERFFDCDTAAFNLQIEDARAVLNRTPTESYDSILLDVFAGDSSPVHLFSLEAFTLMRKALRPQGTLVINAFGSFNSGENFFLGSLDKTLKAAGFSSVRMHCDSNQGNVYVLAGFEPMRLHHFPDFSQVHHSCRADVQKAFNRTVAAPLNAGTVLSDDFNPLEFHDAKNRERSRRGYVASFRTF